MQEPRRIKEDKALRGRTVFAACLILLLVPLVIVFGMSVWDNRKYYLVSLLILLLAMAPMALKYEKRRPQAREIVLLAVMIALGVAGRAAFFMVQQFKPVVAIVTITGVAFGAEAGFISGAAIGFLSNFFFGQGPWTPWQMFGFGVIGFLAGLLFRKGRLKSSRLTLCVFGALATFCIYGPIMDTASPLMFSSELSWAVVLAAWGSGLWFNVIHTAATALFLWLLGEPLLKKLERVKRKFGMLEA